MKLPANLVAPDLIELDALCATKPDAIHHAVQLLNRAGRTQHADVIERAVWRREAASSTALDRGFAIPHCRSRAVGMDSLVILKLRRPVDWGVPEHLPVQLILLMFIREAATAEAHLKILAQLSRRMADENFRERIATARDAAEICALVGTENIQHSPPNAEGWTSCRPLRRWKLNVGC